MKSFQKPALLIAIFFLLCTSVPAYASFVPWKKDWGILVFPAIEEFNLIELYLNWDKSFQTALDEAKNLGMQRTLIAKSWTEIEEQTKDLEKTIQHVKKRNIDIFFGFQLINTVKRDMPDDLIHEAWDSEKMIARVLGVLDRTLPLLDTNRPSYLSFGNEVDIYFEKNPDEIAAYKNLFRIAQAHVHEHYPHIKIGITTTFDGLYRGNTDMITRIQEETDVMIITYYPITFEKVRSPASPHDDFKMMAAFAAGKKIILQEAGFPSSADAGSTEEMQAEFIHHLFAAWNENKEAFDHISLFMQSDFGTYVCDKLIGYYSFESMEKFFRANICTLGLKDAYGTPKKAWYALMQEAKMPH